MELKVKLMTIKRVPKRHVTSFSPEYSNINNVNLGSLLIKANKGFF